ncbi:MAG: hypothetical protein M1840_000315 [Geoglossum simile]|nr:MAG: hypothetical protein M1840_000315 [Geoglossum simile]
MLPRDRITALIDPGTSFLELSPLAGHEMYPEEEVPAGGIITGLGVIEGVICMVVANDSTVKGGTYYPITGCHASISLIPVEPICRIKLMYFPIESILAEYSTTKPEVRPISQTQSWVTLTDGSRGAYVPSMSDESIIVENQGQIFLAGPPLVKAAIGEVVSAEDLGGGRLHSSISGVTDYLAVNDSHALSLARRCVSNLNWPDKSPSHRQRREPLYDPEELEGIASTNLRKLIPVREIIARVVDGSEFAEFKRDYGTTLVTGFSQIYGQQVGIVANNGVLFSESSLKGAHFIELCVQRNIPLVFLQNISGFMVGQDAEKGGIAKNGAKLVTAVACAEVPKFTIVFGASSGAGNYGMCGRAYSPRFLWMWPNARIGVMGSEQLSSVMNAVGKSVDPALKDRIERESDAIFSSARLWDDGIILPSQTRRVLGLGLSAALGGRCEQPTTKFGVFRM